MTFATVEQDKQRLSKFLGHFDEKEWKFDLSKVNLCDSAGIALLLEAKRLSKAKKSHCHFVGISDEMNALIQFCGVEGILLKDNNC